METEQSLRLSTFFCVDSRSRQPGKVKHDFVELLVVAVNGVLVEPTTLKIELWANEKLDWLRSYLVYRTHSSHDTFAGLWL